MPASYRAPFREAGTTDCRIGDTVLVKFENLTEWVKSDPVKHDPANLIIALNNHPLNGTHGNALIANSNLLTFNRVVPEGNDPDSEANKQGWREILRKPGIFDAGSADSCRYQRGEGPWIPGGWRAENGVCFDRLQMAVWTVVLSGAGRVETRPSLVSLTSLNKPRHIRVNPTAQSATAPS